VFHILQRPTVGEDNGAIADEHASAHFAGENLQRRGLPAQALQLQRLLQTHPQHHTPGEGRRLTCGAEMSLPVLMRVGFPERRDWHPWPLPGKCADRGTKQKGVAGEDCAQKAGRS